VPEAEATYLSLQLLHTQCLSKGAASANESAVGNGSPYRRISWRVGRRDLDGRLG
jgi:hypothetical protein